MKVFLHLQYHTQPECYLKITFRLLYLYGFPTKTLGMQACSSIVSGYIYNKARAIYSIEKMEKVTAQLLIRKATVKRILG